MKIVSSPAMERYLFCGNGWGKSTVLINEIHWAAMGYNPFTKFIEPGPSKIALVIDSPLKINDLLLEYRKWYVVDPTWLKQKGKPNISLIEYPNGSTVTILTHDVNPLLLEGSQWTHVFMDEPPPKPVFTGVVRGGRIKGRPCRILLGGTPLSAPWLRTDLYEPWLKGELNNVECFRGTTDDNAENLEMSRVKDLWQKLSPQELKIRREGQFFDLEGLALSHLYKPATHSIDRDKLNWEKNNPSVLVIDCHPSKPHHAILVGADKDNRLYVIEEYKEKSVARRFMESIIKKNWFTQYRIQDIVYDSLGSSEMTSGEGFKSFGVVINEVLSSKGLGRARATTFDEKSDEEFISRIQDALLIPTEPDNFGQYIPKLRFVSDCIGSIGDVLNVQWARKPRSEENKPHLDISHRDYLSCLKYALATNLYFKKNKDKAYYVTKKPYGLDLTPKGPKLQAMISHKLKFGQRRS